MEGLGDYIQIYLKDQKIVTNLSMKKILELLPENKFFRIHKSYIVSLDKLELVEGNSLMVNKKRLPLGNSYRSGFMDFMNKYM